MNKKMIAVGIAVALIITAISVNFAYAGMYGRAVVKSLQPNSAEHMEEVRAANAKERALTKERIKDSLSPDLGERAHEASLASAKAEEAEEELRLHARNKRVEGLVSGGQKGEYQKYAWSRFEDYGWNENDLSCLISLWNKESGWNTNAHNSSSGAHGIPQALPASKMARYGSDYMTGYKTQIDWGLDYIAGRYGSPSNAWGHFCANNWY